MAEPARPFGKRVSYRLQYGVLMGLMGFSRLLGLDRASDFGGWLGRRVLMPLLGKGERPYEHMGIAFPATDRAAREAILAGMWENLGRILMELPHLTRFTGAEGKRRIAFKGRDNLSAALGKGRGAILVTGHFGNWEVAAPAMGLIDVTAAVVTRPPNNPWVARWIEDARSAAGATQQIAKGAEGLRQIFTVLRKRGNVAMLIDQHLAEGIAVPLFGRDAMTTHAPATLARKLDVPVVPFAVRRVKGATFEIEIFPEVARPDTGDADRDVREMTAAINRFVEAEVTRNPSYWLWAHQRWKAVAELTRRASRVADSTRD